MLWRLTGNMSPQCVCVERVDIKINRQHPRMTAGGSRSMECIDCGFLLACLVQQCIDLCWTASVTLCVCVPCVYTHTHTWRVVCVCVCYCDGNCLVCDFVVRASVRARAELCSFQRLSVCVASLCCCVFFSSLCLSHEQLCKLDLPVAAPRSVNFNCRLTCVVVMTAMGHTQMPAISYPAEGSSSTTSHVVGP